VAAVEDVTCNVVEVVPPGFSVSDELAKAEVHPLGTLARRLKVDGAQLALSLLVTETV
jgi:hypothetical protein